MDANQLARHLGSWSVGKGALHTQLTTALRNAIRNGAPAPGSRLPSERDLADALAISRTTVVAAYDALREESWVESRRGSGTYVNSRSPGVWAARQAAHSGALAGSPLLHMLGHSGEDVIDFALGAPQPLTTLPGHLFNLTPEEQQSAMQDRHYYPLGLPALRAAIAGYYTRKGLNTSIEQILITTGAQQGISLAAAMLLQRGDTVLVEDPCYFGALDTFRALGVRMFPLPVQANGVSPAVVRDRAGASAARMIFVTPTYQNPTGVVMPESARKELGRIAADRGIPVVEDVSLAELVLEGKPLAPIAACVPGAPVVTISSISKLMWSGIRIGWIRASEPLIEKLARLKAAWDLSSPVITQMLAVRWIAAIDQAAADRRKQWLPQRDALAEALAARLPDWSFRLPSGGLFLWVRLPSGDVREFAQVALRHGVVILPGTAMSVAEAHSDRVRIPFLADPKTLRLGVDRLASAWGEYTASSQPRLLSVAAIV